jgi:GxxExxY protein
LRNVEELAAIAIDCGLKIHRRFGPGLLESAYEAMLEHCLESRGLRVVRQKSINIEFEGKILKDSFRLDILIEDRLIIEIKSVERTAPIFAKQLLTYLRLTDLQLGLLMNFGAERFSEGLKRVANNYFGDWKGGEANRPS